jgi:hypothetical protein
VVLPTRSYESYDGWGRREIVKLFGDRFWAEQTADVLSIAIDDQKAFQWVYRLDGTLSRHLPLGPTGPQPTSTAAWADGALVITMTSAGRGGTLTATTRRVLRLNDDGTLRIEARTVPNGATSVSVYARER